jgi:hypothetical protein
MNASLVAVRARVVDQGEAAYRKDGSFVIAVRRGPFIDYERDQIRAGDELRHLRPELWRVFTAPWGRHPRIHTAESSDRRCARRPTSTFAASPG